MQKDFLAQNEPNPYINASAAIFRVTDVMGRVISSEKVGTTTGNPFL